MLYITKRWWNKWLYEIYVVLWNEQLIMKIFDQFFRLEKFSKILACFYKFVGSHYYMMAAIIMNVKLKVVFDTYIVYSKNGIRKIQS